MSGAMQALIVAIAISGGLGVFLLMPRAATGTRPAGLALAGLSLALLVVAWCANFGEGDLPAGLVFCLLAALTVVAGVMTVTRRSPVSCALWFASVVIGTSGLFMLQNAQFLAAATIIVYAGAIIVMFLFVVMLAQQSGVSFYDRTPREPALAIISAGILLVLLLSVIVSTHHGESASVRPIAGEPSVSKTAFMSSDAAGQHVAGLGRSLFADHWLSLEIAGAVLLVAMVGAIAIAARKERA